MSDLMYFDCHAVIGERPRKHRFTRWSTEQLIEDMDLAEIAGALAVHSVSVTYDVIYGNNRLLPEIAKAPDRLFGVWCAAPLGSPGFFKTGGDMIAAMKCHDVRAVRIVPGGFPMHPEVMGSTLEFLETHQVLTILEVGSVRYPSGWGTPDVFSFFHDFLSRYPDLPVLLTGHMWDQQWVIYRLMELHKNLHIEFSNFQINRGIEYYVSSFGDDRLLFGSGMTEKSPGAARAFVDYAQISEASKHKIAGMNLKRLLGGQGPKHPVPTKRPHDYIVASARDGKAVPVPILDAHSHTLHEEGQTAGGRYLMLDGDARGILEVSQWCGIDRVAMMSWNAPFCTDAQDGNEIVWRALQSFPERVVGVAVVDPTHMTDMEMQEEIKTRYVEQGFIGMKPYPHMNVHYEDPMFSPWWEFGNRNRLYALVHVTEETGGVTAIARLADRFQNLSWIIAHAGTDWDFAEEVVACIQQRQNVYAEITFTTVTNRCVEFLVESTDEDHIIFGTDQPMRDPRPQLGWVVWSGLSVQAKEKVLGGNFQRILNRVRTPVV